MSSDARTGSAAGRAAAPAVPVGAPRLYHAHEDLTRILGRGYLDRLVYPHIVKDGFKNVLPLVLRAEDGGFTVMVKDGDAGILTYAPLAPHEFVTYGRYFTFNDDPPAKTLPQLLEELVPERAIAVDDSLPLSLYRILAAGFDLTVLQRCTEARLYHHTLDRAGVTARMAAGMDRFREAATRATAGYRHAPELADLLAGVADPGFPLLDEIMERRGLEVLLVTSPFQMEDLSGLPADWLEAAGALLLVRRGDSDLHLLAPSAGEVPGAALRGEFASVREAVARLTEGVPAVEHTHAELSLARALDVEPLALPNASPAIYEWQELRATSQLPFYVLAANSARHALERTIAYAEERLGRGEELRESELARAFDAYLGVYAAEIGLPGSFRPYFRIIHPGERTLVPAAPSENLLTRDQKTIKFDVGTQVLDAGGRVRGCSDIARTICRTPELQRFHETLRSLLLERVIPAIRPGVTGAEVHRAAVEALAEHDDLFRSWGVLPEGRSGREYARDCGHVINRQTICNIYFTPDCDVRVQAGMAGCVEFVWCVEDLVVAVEEAYVVTERGALPTTA